MERSNELFQKYLKHFCPPLRISKNEPGDKRQRFLPAYVYLFARSSASATSVIGPFLNGVEEIDLLRVGGAGWREGEGFQHGFNKAVNPHSQVQSSQQVQFILHSAEGSKMTDCRFNANLKFR